MRARRLHSLILVLSLFIPAGALAAPPGDGPGTEPQRLTCAGLQPTITGTAGNDVIVGTPQADVIAGANGADEIQGRGGEDVICGGSGDDTIDGDAPGYMRFPARPARFGPVAGAEPAGEGCGEPAGTIIHWRNFSEAGRHFTRW